MLNKLLILLPYAFALPFALLLPTSSGQAQSSYALQSITPPAEDISSKVPESSNRIQYFLYDGTIGTAYTAVYSAEAEPALVVGVGADISSTAYDAAAKLLTIQFTFTDQIVTGDTVDIPNNSFLIALDPGVASATGAVNVREDSQVDDGEPERNEPCSGPADRSTKETEDVTIGLPSEFPGTFMSTDQFFWCTIPPESGDAPIGFRISGPLGRRGALKLSLSRKILDYIGTFSGATLTSDNLAIFNDDTQASSDVTARSDGGAAIDLHFPFVDSSSVISEDAETGAGIVLRKDDEKVTFIAKTISVGPEENLSLAPNNFQISRGRVQLYGFAAEEQAFAGNTVQIEREARSGSRVGARAAKVVASTTVKSDGSYTLSIPAKKVFGGRSKVNLQAGVPGDLVHQSREISLSNKNRGLRR